MRLVVSFPGTLSDRVMHHIRTMLDEAASRDEWRTVVLEEGGFIYDLDSPLTIIADNTGRAVIEQSEVLV